MPGVASLLGAIIALLMVGRRLLSDLNVFVGCAGDRRNILGRLVVWLGEEFGSRQTISQGGRESL